MNIENVFLNDILYFVYSWELGTQGVKNNFSTCQSIWNPGSKTNFFSRKVDYLLY